MVEIVKASGSNVSVNDTALVTDNRIHEVARFVASEGYALASSSGIRGDQFNCESKVIGILKDTPKSIERVSVISRLLRGRPRADFIAKLWFENQPRAATMDNWVLEVKGERHLQETKEVADKLSSKYGVKIRIDASAREDKEWYMSDFMM